MGAIRDQNVSNFSQIFPLSNPGANNMPMLVSNQAATQLRKRNTRAKGTTTADPSKESKDAILAQFKSKVLQQMESKMRNAGDLQYRLTQDSMLKGGNKSLVDSPINFIDGNSAKNMRKTSHEGLQTEHRGGSIRVASEEFLPKDFNVRKHNPATTGSVSDYKELLRKTIREHDQQMGKKASYQINPDCRNNLWNMIDNFKGDAMDRKETQITMKNSNAAQQFRKMNMVQKELVDRQRRQAEARDLHDEQKLLAKDMLDFKDYQERQILESN